MIMKSLRILLILAVLALALCCQASDLVQSVAIDDPAYSQMRVLARAGLLTESAAIRAAVMSDKPFELLTRYDFALALLEPIEQFTALVECQDALLPAPELRRRRDQALDVVSRMSNDDFNSLLQSMTLLSKNFRDTITEISPALPARAENAFTKLQDRKYRTWQDTAPKPVAGPEMPVIRVRVTPTSIGDSSRTPLLISPGSATDIPRMMFVPTPGLDNGLSRNPINSFEAAVDATLGRFRLYGMLGSAPGNDISEPSKAGVGLEIGLGHIYALGITGIVEYHVTRGTAPGVQDINAGAVGGIGVKW